MFAGVLPLLSLAMAARVLAYLAISLLLGAWCASAWLVPRAERAHPSAEWAELTDDLWQAGRAAAWLLLAATLARGLLQLADLADPAEPITTRWLSLVLTGTTWGHGWLAQAAVALALPVAWRARRRPLGAALIGAGLLALLACGADALTGHGMAGAWAGWRGVVLHAAHLMGAGIWLGTLMAVALRLARGRTERWALAGPLFRAITPLALLGGALVVAPGVLMGLEYAGGWRALVGLPDDYTRVLVAKAGLAAGVFVLGAWHWRKSVPALLTGASDRAFRRSLGAEILLAGLVLLLSGILVALPAAGV